MVTPAPAFWDASALVPLCVQQATTPDARRQLRNFSPVAWWGTQVEIRSAISRLHKSGLIDADGRQGAQTRLLTLQRSWKEVLPEDSLRDLAGELLETYTLRAADSLQLAAALTWCRRRPSQTPFVCSDERLSVAAESSGFVVKRLRI